MKRCKAAVVFLLMFNILLIAGCNQESSQGSLGNTKTQTSVYADIYIDVFDSYFEIDAGLQEDIKYLAIDMDTLNKANDADKLAIAEHFRTKLNVEIKDASFEDLQEQGLVQAGNYLEGLLLYINRVDVTSQKITVEGIKFRSGLGANGIKSVMEKNGQEWTLKSSDMMWIS